MKKQTPMRQRSFSSKALFAGTAAAVAVLAVGFAIRSDATEAVSVSELTRKTHIHGLAVDRQDPSRLVIATHHGLYRAGPDGKAQRISEVQDFMGFNPHPSEPNVLYASGHPARGGNLGFIASTDGGKTWTQVSPGVNGPVDFHQMTVSPADPKTIYGAYRGLQASRDAGKTWTMVGPTPAGLSTDAGKSWKPLVSGAGVDLVEVTPDGTLYDFVLGRGLVRAKEPPVGVETVGNPVGDGHLLHLAVDPTDPSRLFAASSEGQVLASADQGRTWTAFGGSSS